MTLSNGTKLGFSLEKIAVLLIQGGALNGKQPISERVLARVEAAIAESK
jgi:hypothetical protein